MDIENREPELHILNFEEGNFQTTFTKKFLIRKSYTVPDPKKVFAFIPGTIIKIFVKEKHKIKKGEPLLTFQAMKMNNILSSPMTGRIKKVNVKAGETFTRAQILVEFV
ncbi:MAG: acetyl-CoA carboxylase biotin carboxyl carrier protein subunit [Bacteroidetes bacterium]|nr:MAG: acetyl-CoA carboxylase biotin carboxyl carrier protein subunit [Bacteroidota bacterium]